MRIALLEDDPQQAKIMELWLRDAGHDVQHYDTGRGFINGVARESFDVLLIDWVLPDISGHEVLKWVRGHTDWHVPVLFVTQLDSEENIVSALESGADDYMCKPVSEREMLARVGALARRAHPADDTQTSLVFEPYTIDPANRTITNAGESIVLTQKEYDLALFLFRHLGRVLSRGHILESVWGKNPEINTRTVDTHVSRVRKKLNIGAETGWRLTAIYQHGYRLEPIAEDDSASAADIAGNG